MPWPAAEDFGFAPTRDLFEGVAVDEGFEILLGVPVAKDKERAGGGDVFV